MNWQNQPELIFLFNLALYLLRGMVIELPGAVVERIRTVQPGNILLVVFALVGMMVVVKEMVKILAAGAVLLVGYEVVVRGVLHA